MVLNKESLITFQLVSKAASMDSALQFIMNQLNMLSTSQVAMKNDVSASQEVMKSAIHACQETMKSDTNEKNRYWSGQKRKEC